MRPLTAAAFCALALSACAKHESARPIDGDASIVVEQASTGPWRVTIELARPAAEIDLGPSLDDYRLKYWRSGADAVRLVQREGRDIIEPADGKKSLREALFYVEPAPVDLRKDYEPFIPMGDGGVLFYSGHFLPFGANDERLRAGLTIIAGEGAHVSAFEANAGRLDNWKSPFDHPAFIYVGPEAPAESDAMLTITDSTAPDWISDEVSAFAPAIAGALQSLLQRALPTKPNIFVAMGDLSEEGRLSYSGDALPGQYQMTLAGGAWKVASPQALSVLRRSTAHEAAHLWQAAARPKSDAVPDWIHEGGADALAAEAMLAAGYWTKADVKADLEGARSMCSSSLRQLSLQRAETEGRWDAVYACGHVLNIAAAGDEGVASFWREFVNRTAKDGYDEAAFFALAEERAGKDAAAAIRDLTRINDARPDLAISRMLK